MKEFLETLLKTLNCIEVKGKDNVNYLLGCICAVENMISMLEQSEKNIETEEDNG